MALYDLHELVYFHDFQNTILGDFATIAVNCKTFAASKKPFCQSTFSEKHKLASTIDLSVYKDVIPSMKFIDEE